MINPPELLINDETRDDAHIASTSVGVYSRPKRQKVHRTRAWQDESTYAKFFCSHWYKPVASITIILFLNFGMVAI